MPPVEKPDGKIITPAKHPLELMLTEVGKDTATIDSGTAHRKILMWDRNRDSNVTFTIYVGG